MFRASDHLATWTRRDLWCLVDLLVEAAGRQPSHLTLATARLHAADVAVEEADARTDESLTAYMQGRTIEAAAQVGGKPASAELRGQTAKYAAQYRRRLALAAEAREAREAREAEWRALL